MGGVCGRKVICHKKKFNSPFWTKVWTPPRSKISGSAPGEGGWYLKIPHFSSCLHVVSAPKKILRCTAPLKGRSWSQSDWKEYPQTTLTRPSVAVELNHPRQAVDKTREQNSLKEVSFQNTAYLFFCHVTKCYQRENWSKTKHCSEKNSKESLDKTCRIT